MLRIRLVSAHFKLTTLSGADLRDIAEHINWSLTPITPAMDEGYLAIGNDLQREAEASEWINGLIGDGANAAR